jgi:hypothetical protein
MGGWKGGQTEKRADEKKEQKERAKRATKVALFAFRV